MAITFQTKYPDKLKNAAWQKKKSFKDKRKTNTKTGLGKTLNDAEKAWGKIKFDKLIAAKQGVKPVSDKSIEELRKIKDIADNYLKSPAGPVQKAIVALDQAANMAKIASKNDYLSTTAKNAATTLAAQLKLQAELLRDIRLDDFTAPINRLHGDVNKVEGQHTEMLHAMDEVIDKLESAQDTDKWPGDKILQYVKKGMKASLKLSELQGDKTWADTHQHWRRIMMAYAETDQKVKTYSGEYRARAMQEFARTAQHELGGLYF